MTIRHIWKRAGRAVALSAVAMVVAGCGKEPPRAEAPIESGPRPVVTESTQDLLLTWLSPDGLQVAKRVADVPQAYRQWVRVQDPAIAPELRDPSRVFIADLREAGADGSYPVRVVARQEWNDRIRPPQDGPEPLGAGAGTSALPQGAVVMYSTKHCPVCKKARRWLLEQRIPYVEKDIETDPAAADALRTKGRAQGVPTNGVPVFEVRGRLIPGFDPAAISKALSSGAPPLSA